MGKNYGNSWLNAVKKAFRSPNSNDHDKRSNRRREENEQEQDNVCFYTRGKKRWIFGKNLPLETTIQHNVSKKSANSHAAVGICTSAENLVIKQPKLENSSEERRAIALAEAAVATAQAAVEIIRRSTKSPLLMKESKAAVTIQSNFRGYLARRALLALKGVVKLQALIRGHNVRKRAKTTLHCIQSLVRVQTRVCDQRRRLSYEATSCRNSISRNASNTSNSVDDHPFGLEEIQSLIQKAKECSLKQGKTLAHALSHQMRRFDEDHFPDNIYRDEFEEEHGYQSVRKDRNLCNQTDPVKILEIDTSSPYNHKSRYQNSYLNSPKTPSSSKIRSIQAYSCSPRYQKPEMPPTLCSNNLFHRMSIGEKSCHVARPNYMAATASAMARIRSNSTPRQRPMSPSRERTDSVKKRLSFPAEGHNADDKVNDQRMNIRIHEQRSNVSSCCTY
ncbi:hypothetical protein BUALT_Bualt06G0084000 [Buddleja alternifolia]|uniref:DUF4005 domain-containing protein n=1 Tax=Buddleja alternifolia TaxID=168488 RepID=A0AAV6XKE1_9LAMI|nr:hypothetical protein BUALT_Bualt06G0084000 [Buddleja alternifolia]